MSTPRHEKNGPGVTTAKQNTEAADPAATKQEDHMNSTAHDIRTSRQGNPPAAFRQHDGDNYVGPAYSVPGLQIFTTWNHDWGFRFDVQAAASLNLADAKYLHAALTYLLKEAQR